MHPYFQRGHQAYQGKQSISNSSTFGAIPERQKQRTTCLSDLLFDPRNFIGEIIGSYSNKETQHWNEWDSYCVSNSSTFETARNLKAPGEPWQTSILLSAKGSQADQKHAKIDITPVVESQTDVETDNPFGATAVKASKKQSGPQDDESISTNSTLTENRDSFLDQERPDSKDFNLKEHLSDPLEHLNKHNDIKEDFTEQTEKVKQHRKIDKSKTISALLEQAQNFDFEQVID